MVSNIFADVADGTIGANDNFLVLLGYFRSLRASPSAAHYPTAGILSLFLTIKNALVFQLLERGVPELEAKDLALARQKVVLDRQPLHGFKMNVQDGS